jgi:hypothetical protein
MFDIVLEYVHAPLKNGLFGIVVLKEKDEETRKRYAGSIQEIHSQWVMPNWKQSNDMLRRATRWDSDAGQRVLDWPTYRSLIMENFMRMWDIKDEQGGAVPCVKDNMERLDPNIAASLVEKFLSKTSVTEKDLGN